MDLFCLQWENNGVDNLLRTITYLRSHSQRAPTKPVSSRKLMNAITHLHTQNVTFLTLHCHLKRRKNTLGQTSELRASCKSFHNLKHWIKGVFLIKLIMKMHSELLIFLFLVLWLNFRFLLSIVFTQESHIPSCAAPNPWHLEKSPHWMPLYWQSSPELDLAQVDMTALPTYYESELPKAERKQKWARFEIFAHGLGSRSFI